MKKGFATSAILYTLLLLFMTVMVGMLNNLENKKTILDALKQDTINALEQDAVTDTILDQIAIINSKVLEIESKISNYEANTYTKTEIDSMLHDTIIREGFTSPSNVKILGGGYTKTGNVVVGNFTITISAEVPKNTFIIEGLPSPLLDYIGNVEIYNYFTGETIHGVVINNKIYTSSALDTDNVFSRYSISVIYLIP